MNNRVLDISVREGLPELYVRYLPSALRLGYLLTGSRDEAEDLAQEAFVRLVGKFSHLRAPELFETYLRKTVVNLFVSKLRRLRLERRRLHSEAAGLQGQASIPDGPATDVASRQSLWAMLQRLPHRQRAAIVLRYYEDLSERQIADVLGTSIPGVKSLLKRGLDTLREHMKGQEEW
jgi:RNA polymerase sigma-70 factor (sigma-E family)